MDSGVCPHIPPFHTTHTFDSDLCLARVRSFLGNVTSTTPATCMSDYFVHGLNTSSQNPIITYEGCRTFCGDKGWYTDPGPRVTEWIIPIFFLLSNIDLSPIDKRRFFAVIHALGDPIDSLWSLIDKLYTWRRCYAVAKDIVKSPRKASKKETQEDLHHIRIIATVLAGFEEIAGHAIESEAFYKTVARSLGRIGEPSQDAEAFRSWRMTAVSLVDDRTNEFLRTGLAIGLYLFQVVSEFVDAISGEPENAPNGRIAAALLLSWLLPVTLLSNALGNFPSRRTCLKNMMYLVQATQPRSPILHPSPLVHVHSWKEYFDSLPTLGAIYTFRPFKASHLLRSRGRALAIRLSILTLSFLPVLFAFTAAFSMLWKANPNGFSCRHVWVLGVFSAWIFSAALTSTTHHWLRSNWHWWLVFTKEFVIGCSSILLIFLSVAGLFNSCYCWSLRLWLGGAAYWPLEKHAILLRYKSTTYTAIVTTFLGAQIVLVIFVITWFRKGLVANRWSEEHKRGEWEGAVGHWRVQNRTAWLFWRPAGERGDEKAGIRVFETAV